jgi:hypothetical protein
MRAFPGRFGIGFFTALLFTITGLAQETAPPEHLFFHVKLSANFDRPA